MMTIKKSFWLEIYCIVFVCGTVVAYPFLIIFAIYSKLLKCMRNKKKSQSISGQVAVITGSAGGLGRILAIELAKRGCHVAIVDVQYELAEKTALDIAQKYQVKAKSYKVDVSDYEQLVELEKNVTRDLGDVMILINNAAILLPSSIENPSVEDIQSMINVNFAAICFCTKVFLPKMKALNRGHIVNVASAAALCTCHLFDIYASTKAAVRSLTSALRMQLMTESKNITATTVMPMFLTSNEQVNRLLSTSGYTKWFPVIEGSLAPQYILDGMLHGAAEITIPYGVLYLYKIFELLPVTVKESIIQYSTPKMEKDVPRVQKAKEG